jgi:hypothetical protein
MPANTLSMLVLYHTLYPYELMTSECDKEREGKEGEREKEEEEEGQ